MARPEDDEDAEALTWAGDEETGRAAPRLRDLTAESATGEPAAADDDEPEAPGSRGRRVAAVAFAVPYLALTIGWIFSVQLADSPAQLFAAILWQFGEFLAMLAAPLWFAATLSLTRDARPRTRAIALAVGFVVLLPWPIVLRFLAALQVAGSLS